MPDVPPRRFTGGFFISYRILIFIGDRCAKLINDIRLWRTRLLYRFSGFALDTDRRELRRGQSPVSITPQVYDIVEHLLQNRDRVVTKDDLLKTIWKGRLVSESALTTRMNAARAAIGDTGEEQRLIRTLPRRGFRFVGTVREEQRPASPHKTGIAIAAEKYRCPAMIHPDRPSIAVLPFANLSGNPDQDLFADGLAEEIITALSRCSRLFVSARKCSFTYKGKVVDVRQIGRELGVRYVLDGSIRRDRNRMRFTGHLIDARSGGHIWAERFEGHVGNGFELQDRLTESIVAAVEPKLQLAEIERLKSNPGSDRDPY